MTGQKSPVMPSRARSGLSTHSPALIVAPWLYRPGGILRVLRYHNDIDGLFNRTPGWGSPMNSTPAFSKAVRIFSIVR